MKTKQELIIAARVAHEKAAIAETFDADTLAWKATAAAFPADYLVVRLSRLAFESRSEGSIELAKACHEAVVSLIDTRLQG